MSENWEKNNCLTLEIQRKKSDDEKVSLVCENNPAEILLNGNKLNFEKSKIKGICTFKLDKFKEPDLFQDISDNWGLKMEKLSDDRENWMSYEPGRSLESYKIFSNGYFRFHTSFEIQNSNEDIYMEFTGFHHDATLYINKQFAGNWEDRIHCDIRSFIREGINEIDMYLECKGHLHSGMKTFNGITSPVGLYGNSKQMTIETWRRYYNNEYPIEKVFQNMPEESRYEFDDSSWETVTLKKNNDDLFHGISGDRVMCWYRGEITIDRELEKKNLLLDIPVNNDTFVYVNGEYLGAYFRDDHKVFDISEKLFFDKKNVIVIGIRSRDTQEGVGIRNPIKILIFDRLIKENWEVKTQLLGEESGWHNTVNNDSGWLNVASPKKYNLTDDVPVLWWRKTVKIEGAEEFISPFRLTLEDVHSKALIFFNGVLLGRYSDAGPQKDFYIFEDIIKKENNLVIAVEGKGKIPLLGEVTISPYYIAKKEHIELIWK